MKQLIAYCGLDCEKCDARKATINNDDALREKTARAWSEMNKVDITAEMINCMGCRAEGVKFAYCQSLCPIRKCAMEKGFKTCGDCPEVATCPNVGMVIGNNAEARECLLSLETERLLLRPWRNEDAARLYELAKDPAVGPAAGWEPHQSVEESREIISTVFNKPTIYAVVLRATGELIGCCGFFYDENSCKDEREALMGYWLGTEYWGHGYTTEAARECLRHAFNDLNLRTMWCGNFIENSRSARVQEKLGFHYHHTETSNHWSGATTKTTVINRLVNPKEMTKKVRITAVRKVSHGDLQTLYENPIEHACDVMEGQVWLSVDGQRPEGLCESAWGSMREFVEELARGGGYFYDGWMKNPHSAMISCNDGFRPVSFLIEAID